MHRSVYKANVIAPVYFVVTEIPNTDAVNIEISTTDKAEAVTLAYRLRGHVITATDVLNLTRTGDSE